MCMPPDFSMPQSFPVGLPINTLPPGASYTLAPPMMNYSYPTIPQSNPLSNYKSGIHDWMWLWWIVGALVVLLIAGVIYNQWYRSIPKDTNVIRQDNQMIDSSQVQMSGTGSMRADNPIRVTTVDSTTTAKPYSGMCNTVAQDTFSTRAWQSTQQDSHIVTTPKYWPLNVPSNCPY